METETYVKKLMHIAAGMFRIGCLTFGGGWSIVVQMEEEFVSKRGYITQEGLTDALVLGRSFPGIMIINTAVIFGYQVSGIAGAFVAAVSLSLPALISIAVVTYFYSNLRDNVLITKILAGVRCAVVPIILSAGLKLRTSSLTSAAACVMAALSFFLCGFTGINKLYVVIMGGAAGYVLFRREGKQ